LDVFFDHHHLVDNRCLRDSDDRPSADAARSI